MAELSERAQSPATLLDSSFPAQLRVSGLLAYSDLAGERRVAEVKCLQEDPIRYLIF